MWLFIRISAGQTMRHEHMEVIGVRIHTLKHIGVRILRHKLTVIRKDVSPQALQMGLLQAAEAAEVEDAPMLA